MLLRGIRAWRECARTMGSAQRRAKHGSVETWFEAQFKAMFAVNRNRQRLPQISQ